jgi:hypothetical protein
LAFLKTTPVADPKRLKCRDHSRHFSHSARLADCRGTPTALLAACSRFQYAASSVAPFGLCAASDVAPCRLRARHLFASQSAPQSVEPQRPQWLARRELLQGQTSPSREELVLSDAKETLVWSCHSYQPPVSTSLLPIGVKNEPRQAEEHVSPAGVRLNWPTTCSRQFEF